MENIGTDRKLGGGGYRASLHFNTANHTRQREGYFTLGSTKQGEIRGNLGRADFQGYEEEALELLLQVDSNRENGNLCNMQEDQNQRAKGETTTAILDAIQINFMEREAIEL
ncbi:hypothetical protein H5410_042418 [Solanum commersonii]|uniref:Uncharacterized protein n=1 Tax=Solanum commersonii TaxID=4109 RepID=A0A9J5XXG3_SOLCO|nr:hypothetical protein H5410_042418 [Solanum commersonii]